MAITKIFTVRTRLDHLLSYITDGEKTGNGILVTGLNCAPETAYESMSASFTLNDKPLRVQGYHIIQSFAPDECSSNTAHEIGVKLAERLFGDSFQAVIATHINTGAYHNHIAICSTSFIDGRRYHSCKDNNLRIREASDALCREHGLSVIENPKQGRYKTASEVVAERSGRPTWKSVIKQDVDEAIAKAVSAKQFVRNLQNLGYEVKIGADISVRPPGKERFMRLARNFGEQYTHEGIRSRILSQPYPRLSIPGQRHYAQKPKGLPPVARGSIVALYRHYLYLMGYWQQRGNSSSARMHYLLREDIAKLDAYIEDVRLLGREDIHTKSQLDAFYHRTSRAIEELLSERQPLYRIARNSESPDDASNAKSRITAINSRLKLLRKQLRQYDRIQERAATIADRVLQIENSHDPMVQKSESKKARHGYHR